MLRVLAFFFAACLNPPATPLTAPLIAPAAPAIPATLAAPASPAAAEGTEEEAAAGAAAASRAGSIEKEGARAREEVHAALEVEAVEVDATLDKLSR